MSMTNCSFKKIYKITAPELNKKYSVRISHVGEDHFHVQIVSIELQRIAEMESIFDGKRHELRNHPKLKVSSYSHYPITKPILGWFFGYHLLQQFSLSGNYC